MSCSGRIRNDSAKCRYRRVTSRDGRIASASSRFQLTFDDVVTSPARKRTARSAAIVAVQLAAIPL